MDPMLPLVAQFILAPVLAFAALAKLARWQRSLTAAAALLPLGPPALARIALGGTILAEAAGAALLAGLSPRAGAFIALVLGVIFAVALVATHLRGVHRIACGCFGGASERPTLLLLPRALLLVLSAVPILTQWGEGWYPGREAIEISAIVLLSLAVIALLGLVGGLYRQVGVLLQRLPGRAALELASEGPSLGQPAPAHPDLWRTGVELVSFSAAGCRMCMELAPGLRALARSGTRLVVAEEGSRPDIFADWRVPGAPYLVVTVDGLVAAKGLVNTLEQAEGLLTAALDRRAKLVG